MQACAAFYALNYATTLKLQLVAERSSAWLPPRLDLLSITTYIWLYMV
jgi:hypothetical protein